MKNIIRTIAILFVVGFSIVSCESFLEENPQGRISQDTFFKSENDLKLGVIGLYDILNNASMYGFNIGIVGELGTDTYTTSSNNTLFEPLDNYTLTDTYSGTEEIWEASYRGIARINFYINGVETSELVTEDVENTYLAEAYTLRALLYFNLVRFFGDVPLTIKPAEGLSEVFIRNPKEDVYGQIVKDLIFAKEHLPVQLDLIGRATKGAAHGLLTKVYLTMAGAPLNKGSEYYQLALSEADEFIALSEAGDYPYQLLSSYKKVFAEDNENNAEIIFDAQAVSGPLEGNRWGKWGGYQGNATQRESIDDAAFGNPKVMVSFYKSYANEDETRLRWNVTDSMYRGNGTFGTFGRNNVHLYTAAKFRPDPNSFTINGGTYTANETPRNIPILRYDDILLMAAEAENEVNGPTAKALGYLNQVRNRVKITEYDGTNFVALYPSWQAADAGINLNDPKDRFREVLFWERGWELCYEGHRRNDLVRWNRLVPTVRNVIQPDHEATNNGLNANLKVVSHLNIQDFHVLLPIPAEEIGVFNNDFEQNPGY